MSADPTSAEEPKSAPAAELTATHSITNALVALVANVTVLTALLYFFGWRRTATQDYRLGVSPTIFGLRTEDYLLRSVGPVLRLLAVVGVLAMVAVYLDRYLSTASRDPRRARLVRAATRWTTRLAWLVLPLVILLLNRLWPANGYIYIAFPLAVGVGVLLLLYRVNLRRRSAGAEPEPTGRLRLERAATALLVGVALFWAASNYAEVDGNKAADTFTADIYHEGSVTVYSQKSLALGGGIEERLTAPDGLYKFRYHSLWLMAHMSGRYYLISDDWQPGAGPVIVLPDNDSTLRIEFGG